MERRLHPFPAVPFRLAGWIVVLALAACGVRSAAAESTIVLPKAGQVGLGVAGGFGSLLSSGNVGSVFGSGPALCIRLRYRMRYDRAIGLSFENQQLDARQAAPAWDPAQPDSNVAPTKISLMASGFELYQMFGTRTRTTRMLMVGAGLVQLRGALNDGETQVASYTAADGTVVFPWAGDGVYLSAGAGLERFVYRSWAVDLSTRYLSVFRDGKPNHDLQAALGMIFYASY